MMSTSHIEMWIPGASSGAVEQEVEGDVLELEEANQPATYAPAA